MKSAFSIKDVKKFVEENSDCKLISSEYKNADSVISLICKCSNEYSVKFRYFKYQNRRTCEECRDKKNGIIYNLGSAREFVFTRSGGKCKVVSSVYVDNKTDLEIECHCGRVFRNSITNLKQKKKIQCNHCSHNKFRMSEEELTDIANSGFCKILNIKEYVNENSRLDFSCRCGDVFSTSLASFKENSKVCRTCYAVKMSESQRNGFDDVMRAVEGTGCELLSSSKSYINQYSKLRFKCSCGKKFSRSFANFVRREKLCPSCTSSTGERVVEEHLEKQGVNFKKEFSFNDLTSDKGYPLRFDFSIMGESEEVIGLIEYDGEFHYMPIVSEELLKKQKYHDELKNEFCDNKNIPLLRIPYFEFERIDEIIDEFIYKLIPR